MGVNNIVMKRLNGSDNALGIYDESVPVRILDVWGDDVVKFNLQTPEAVDDTTGNPNRFVMTVVEGGAGDTEFNAGTTAGISAVITTAANEYDGINLQALGTSFDLATGKPVYFGIKCSISDATQSDLLIGLAGLDTTLMATSSAHALSIGAGFVGFTKLDAVTQSYFKTFMTTAETNSAAVGTIDTDAHEYEFYWDGATLFAYYDGVLVTSFTDDIPTVALTPSINFRAGAAAAKSMSIYWMRAFRIGS